MSTSTGAGGDAGGSRGKCMCTCVGPCTCAGGHVGPATYLETSTWENGDKRKDLFIDEEFPVGTDTLADDVPSYVKWKRPHELCDNPQLFVDGANRLDVLQGEDLGNCWLIAACSALAEHPDLVKELLPDGSELKYSDKYTGKVTIRLWTCGARQDIVIDDRLPVIEIPNVGLKLRYGTCKESTEFWLPLIEKAFAKYQGGYKNLPGRQLSEGLIILTGYSVNIIDLVHNPVHDLFRLLETELDRKSLIVCAGMSTEMVRISRAVVQEHCSRGNAAKKVHHSFTVNKFLQLSDGTQLVRVRNPWGREPDCSGKWRIREDSCTGLSEAIKEELMVSPCNDGEYWVDIKGFYDKFLELCIANKNPSVYMGRLVPSTNEASFRGIWEGETAAGSPETASFTDNPQFLFQVDLLAGEGEEQKTVPVLVELIQDLHRESPTPSSSGFQIYLLAEELAGKQSLDGRPLRRYTDDELLYQADVLSSGGAASSCAACAVRQFHVLQAGALHVAVPWAEKGRRGAFLLRVFTAGAVVRMSPLPAQH